MWRFQLKPLFALSQVNPSRIFCRHRHSGLSKLDSLRAGIMSGNAPQGPLAGQSQQAQKEQQQPAQIQEVQEQQNPDYSTWSTTSLIERITELERQLHSRNAEYKPAPSASTSTPTKTQAHLGKQKEVPRWLATGKYDPDDITHTPAVRPPKQPKKMDPSQYNFRFIALKFAYLGQRYQGLEHANNNPTALPTIEEEMWKALMRTRLIFPTDMGDEDVPDRKAKRKENEPFNISWEGCEYSKAGRTDRGVSAFGQVIGLKVRSARPKRKEPKPAQGSNDTAETTRETVADEDWDDIADELPYISLLNKALPEDIRVLAWCPNPPEGFDARYSCRERHYKYFFTQPAFSPTPGPLGLLPRRGDAPPKYREGWLDIDAMREAAKYFEGVHDFRNFCKVDTSKQIENFERIIYRADIELLDPRNSPLGYVNRPEFSALNYPDTDSLNEKPEGSVPPGCQVYVFNLQGSAFLWHQVRHMVGILFLVGQGLESPSVVRELLDVTKNPRKPMYEMASDAPLVLWNCVFPAKDSETREDALEWVYAGDTRQARSEYAKGSGKYGVGGVVDDLWAVWRQRKMDEILAGALLDLVVQQGDQNAMRTGNIKNLEREKQNKVHRVFGGANEGKAKGQYFPLAQKRKMDTVEVQNARYLAAKQRRTDKKDNGDGAE
ncbi:pseudouridine synthase [Aspergillus tetrazonus]